ncbi:Phenazine biosynthesis-like domain-containing protein [Thalictrum thalictroides]|uniref:Phenazine biosynthesis-like domain-containing protein n=1 Tax=Thalictrum thalictroides TaxID=46969 RepID=A0A7J6VRA3_THATH|nr:Phenazine biosynthesis-like domain-containing protein [Thalictrum thalictroides]
MSMDVWECFLYPLGTKPKSGCISEKLDSRMAESPGVKIRGVLVATGTVDAFTDSPFKGNPAAVCLLEEERDDDWLQSVAKEFNISQTGFLTPIVTDTESTPNESLNSTYLTPRFCIRWFTPVAEVKLCGHATLAAAHVLFATGLVKSNIIEFSTLSGILTAKKVGAEMLDTSSSLNGKAEDHFSVELDFPTDSVVECEPYEIPSIPLTLKGAPMINIKKMATTGDLIVELPSGMLVADLQPNLDEIHKCAGRGVIITGIAPRESGFDFFSRFFCPKFGINEDPVCGSAHCGLAPYWSKKLGKCDLKAYMASPRGGILDLHLNEETQRLLIGGRSVIVMEGSLLA